MNEKRTLLVAIDPGLAGAICAIDLSTNEVVMLEDLPTEETEINHRRRRKYKLKTFRKMLKELKKKGKIKIAVVERQQPLFRDGKIAAYSTGFGAGVLEAMLNCFSIPYKLV